MSGLVRLSSGVPFSAISGRDLALRGSGRNAGPLRPNVVGDPVLPSGRPKSEWLDRYFDTSAFAPNASGQFGNAGRKVLIGPGLATTYIGVQKRIALPSERWGRIEFRGEIFSLFNRANFNNPNSTLVAPAFGRILGAGDARVVQFALRWDF